MAKNVHPFWQTIRVVPDFPKQGIDFYDITPLMYHEVKSVVDALLLALPKETLDKIDCFVGIEARGFLFASLLAGHTGKGLLLVRKQGKLPPPVVRYDYTLEYGSDTLEMQAGLPSANVLLVDDVLATGGTLKATVKLCQEAGHQVLGGLVLLDLVDLHQSLDLPMYSVLTA